MKAYAAALALTAAACTPAPFTPVETALPATTTTTAPPEIVAPTTTTAVATTTTHVHPRASRSRPRPVAARLGVRGGGGDARTVSSTAYCLTGTMANGQRVYRGAAAMNGVPLGSVWQVDGGGTYTVADRIGSGTEFDIWISSCDEARAYGRRLIRIRRV